VGFYTAVTTQDAEEYVADWIQAAALFTKCKKCPVGWSTASPGSSKCVVVTHVPTTEPTISPTPGLTVAPSIAPPVKPSPAPDDDDNIPLPAVPTSQLPPSTFSSALVCTRSLVLDDGTGTATAFTLLPRTTWNPRPAWTGRCGAKGKGKVWLYFDSTYQLWVVSKFFGSPPFLFEAKEPVSSPDLLQPGSWSFHGSTAEKTMSFSCKATVSPTALPSAAPTAPPTVHVAVPKRPVHSAAATDDDAAELITPTGVPTIRVLPSFSPTQPIQTPTTQPTTPTGAPTAFPYYFMKIGLKNIESSEFQKRKSGFIATVAAVVGLPVQGVVLKHSRDEGKRLMSIELEMHATREYSGFHQVMTPQFQSFLVKKLGHHGFQSNGVSVTPPSSSASPMGSKPMHGRTPKQEGTGQQSSNVMLRFHWRQHTLGMELVIIAVAALIVCLVTRNRGTRSAKVQDMNSETEPIYAAQPGNVRTAYAQPRSNYDENDDV
jgi:hypothetical protein